MSLLYLEKKMFFNRTYSFSRRSHQVSQTWQNGPDNQWRKWHAWQLCSLSSILLVIVRDRPNMHGKLAFKFIYPHFLLQGAFKQRTQSARVCISVFVFVWVLESNSSGCKYAECFFWKEIRGKGKGYFWESSCYSTYPSGWLSNFKPHFNKRLWIALLLWLKWPFQLGFNHLI